MFFCCIRVQYINGKVYNTTFLTPKINRVLGRITADKNQVKYLRYIPNKQGKWYRKHSGIIDLVITIIKKPAIFMTGLVARMGLEPVCAIGAYEDFLRKWKRWFLVSYVLIKPKSVDFNRIQGVFSSRRGVFRKYKCVTQSLSLLLFVH